MRRVALFLVLVCAVRVWAVPVQVLATGDMHGWIEPAVLYGQVYGGSAEMLAHWRAAEGYTPEKFLLVSCGDVATGGPAISTKFNGEPAIAVMNQMGYDVSALGNHEFDNGVQGFRAIRQWAAFPFLATNLMNPDDSPTNLAEGTLLYDEQGVKVGIIGLTVKDLNRISSATGFQVKPYADAVRAQVPVLKAQGAQTIIVVAHAEMADLTALARAVADLQIPLMLGGHSHEFGQQLVDSTWVVNSGEWWRGYSRIDLDVDPQSGRTLVRSVKQIPLVQAQQTAKADPEIKAIIADWRKRLPAQETKPIAYTETGLARPWGVSNFVTDCWLAAYPSDIAMTNLGGYRQDLSSGDITRLDVFGVLPFNDALYRIKITGAQLAAFKSSREVLMLGGVRKKGDQYYALATGQPLEATRTYRLLTTDYLYNISPELRTADPNPEKVDTDWRNPVYKWLAEHPTSKDKPLEKLVDLKPRIE